VRAAPILGLGALMGVFMTKYRLFKNIIAVATMTIFILLTSCGRADGTRIGTEKVSREKLESTDILATKWVAPAGTPIEAEGWEVSEYMPGVSGSSDMKYFVEQRFTAFLNNKLYSVLCCRDTGDTEGDYLYELCIYDYATKESTHEPFCLSGREIIEKPDSFSAEEFDKENYYIQSIGTLDDDLIVFAEITKQGQEGAAKPKIEHYYMIRLTKEGTVKEIIDYAKKVRNESEEYLMLPTPFCMNEEQIVFIYNEGKVAEILDKKAKVKAKIDMTGDLYRLKMIGRSLTGKAVFMCNNQEGKTEFFTLDEDGKNTLTEFNANLYSSAAYLDEYGNVIILNDSKLSLYNAQTGEVKSIYSFNGLSGFDCLNIYRNSDNEIYVCFKEWGDAFLYKVDDDEHPDTKELLITTDFKDTRIEDCAADYMRSHPGVKIRVESLEDIPYRDEYAWAKFVQKVKDGEGPDLIWTSRDRLEALNNVGVICPLDDLITQEVKENVFAGALKFGEINSKLYAIPFDASLELMFIDKKNFENDSWTVTEALDAYERFSSGNEGAYFNANTVCHMILADLCVRLAEYSEFIDMDNMSCNFNNENFYRLLRFCKEHADVKPDNTDYISSEQEMKNLKEGKGFITYCSGGLASYSELRKTLGDDFHTVGITSDKNVKSAIVCYRGMAMSEMSEHKDVAADFIMTLTDEDYQIKYNPDGLIRKDVLREHVKNGWELTVWEDGELIPDDEPAFVMYGGVRKPLAGREDGSSYLDEFIKLMDMGVPILGQTYIHDIILEESNAYFAGEKTEYEVADIIQSRVYLYLQERK